jgi:protein phosphatase
MSGFVAQGTAVSDAGRVRGTNEDRVLLLDRAGPGASLYAVADGLGGHPQGYVASDLAVATLREEVPGLLAEGLPPREALARAFQRAHRAIRSRSRGQGPLAMATTCTAVLVAGREAVIGHVGDTRAYVIRGGKIRQLTTDHSLVAELQKRGAVDPSDARTHAQRHVLTRALGIGDEAPCDLLAVPLRSGDRLLLVSDGIHAAVGPGEVLTALRRARDDEEACRLLVGLANARGGLDNASAVLVRVRPRWQDTAARVAAPVAVALFLAAGGLTYRLEHSYFLGVSRGRVAVLRGIPARPLGVPLYAVVRSTSLSPDDIPPAYRGRVLQGIPAESPEDALTRLRGLLSRP